MRKISFMFIIALLFFAFVDNSLKVFAHQSLLNIEYDNCAKNSDADCEDERWYYLIEDEYLPSYDSDLVTDFRHLSHEVQNIEYYFETYDYEGTGYTWTENISLQIAEEIRNAYIDSMEKWNDVYYYTYDSNGTQISNKIINVVEGTENNHNLTIYPIRHENAYYSYALTTYVGEGEKINTGINNTNHVHNNEWRMSVNYSLFYENDILLEDGTDTIEVAREIVGAHEIGHVLGLDDMNIRCSGHHQEVLMGYTETNSITNRALSPTYKDIVGVSILRGFHDDDDHIWMKRTNSNDTIDLICAQCNGVLYNVSMDSNGETYQGKQVNIFGDCVHQDMTSNNCNMLLVATNGEQNFYKCQNCRHIASINIENDYNLGGSSNTFSVQEILGVEDEKYYKVQVTNNMIYNFILIGDNEVDLKIFDNNFNEIIINDLDALHNKEYISALLSVGTYFIQIKNKGNSTDTLLLQLSPNGQTFINYGETNILNNQNYNVGSYSYTSGDASFYKISLIATSLHGDVYFPENAIMVYDSSDRNELMKRLDTSIYTLEARSIQNVNNLVVYLQEGQTCCIDINLATNDLTSLKINIEKINFSYDMDLPLEYDYTIMLNETQIGDKLEKIAIFGNASIAVEYDYDGTQNETIYFVMFKEVYNINTHKYTLELVFPEMMVPYGESLYWISPNEISSGTYYIGYFNKVNPLSTISIIIE